MTNRRNFLKSALAGSAALAASSAMALPTDRPVKFDETYDVIVVDAGGPRLDAHPEDDCVGDDRTAEDRNQLAAPDDGEGVFPALHGEYRVLRPGYGYMNTGMRGSYEKNGGVTRRAPAVPTLVKRVI